MKVELGPVSSAAAMAWVNYAREVLGNLRHQPGAAPERVLDLFGSYLEEWSAAAKADPVFRWVGDAPAELVEYLVTWLYRLGEHVEDAAEEGRMRLRPPEADKFHVLLVRGALAALEAEGPSQRQFVELMRAKWSGAIERDR